EKRLIGKFSSPRWEVDLIAYKGQNNEVLAVECKSFLDSAGVIFRNGAFEPEKRYKLFTDATLRSIVLERLRRQLELTGACASNPRLTLCLAAGKIAKRTDRAGLEAFFLQQGWK